MKKLDLGQTMTILANVGVIAGIVFLGIELQQNNELLAAQARRDQLDARAVTLESITENSELALLSFKLENGEELTPLEQHRFEAWAVNNFIQWEWQYNEIQAGSLAGDVPFGGWSRRAQIWPQLREVWRNLPSEGRSPFGPEFIRYVEENIFNR